MRKVFTVLAIVIALSAGLCAQQNDAWYKKKKKAAFVSGGGGTSNCGFSDTSSGAGDGGIQEQPTSTPCTTGSDSNGYGVSTVFWYNASTGTQDPINLGVYANSSNHPSGSAICSVTMNAVTVSNWNSASISGCGTLSASTLYWIVMNNDSDYGTLIGTNNGGNCPGYAFGTQGYTASSGTAALPSPWDQSSAGDYGECEDLYIVVTAL